MFIKDSAKHFFYEHAKVFFFFFYLSQVCWQFICDTFHLLHDAPCQVFFIACLPLYVHRIYRWCGLTWYEYWTSSAISKPSTAESGVVVHGCVVLWPRESVSGIFFRFSHARQKTGPPWNWFCPEKRYKKKQKNTHHLFT